MPQSASEGRGRDLRNKNSWVTSACFQLPDRITASTLATRYFPYPRSAAASNVHRAARAGNANLIAIHLIVFFVCALACHGELARRRPAPQYLTAFYMWVSAGGMVGGVATGSRTARVQLGRRISAAHRARRAVSAGHHTAADPQRSNCFALRAWARNAGPNWIYG